MERTHYGSRFQILPPRYLVWVGYAKVGRSGVSPAVQGWNYITHRRSAEGIEKVVWA
jgi:hypothetical protein